MDMEFLGRMTIGCMRRVANAVCQAGRLFFPTMAGALLLSLCSATSSPLAAQDASARTQTGSVAQDVTGEDGVMRLVGGDFVAGRFGRSDQSGVIPWLYPHFSGTLQVAADRVTHISFAAPKNRQIAKGRFCFDLKNGDRICGGLVSADDSDVVIATPDWGNVTIARSDLWQVTPWSDGERLLFAGPEKDASWRTARPGEDRWHGIGGIIRTEKTNSIAALPIAIPRQCMIDVEVSWEGTPSFSLAIGDVVPPEEQSEIEADKEKNKKARGNNRNAVADRPGNGDGPSLRLEIWEGTLVLVWESEEFADLAPVGPITDFGHRLRVLVELDRDRQEAKVLSPSGELLASVRTSEGAAEDGLEPGIRLRNITGTLQLDSLQIIARGKTDTAESEAASPVDADADAENEAEASQTDEQVAGDQQAENVDQAEESAAGGVADDKSADQSIADAGAASNRSESLIETTDGRRLDGRWTVDPEGQWSVEGSDGPIVLSSDDIELVRLSANDTETVRNASKPSGDQEADRREGHDDNEVQLLTQSGIRLTGGQWSFEDGALQLEAACFGDSVTIPASQIARVRPRWQVYSQEDWQAMARKFPVMEAESLRLHGELLDSSPDAEPSPLKFLPTGMTAVTMSDQINAVMQLVPPQAKAKGKSASAGQLRRPRHPVEQIFSMANKFLDAFPKDYSNRPSRIFLNTGEILSVALSQMDERRIAYRSEWTENTRLSRTAIRAVKLAPMDEDFALDEEERDRLLMVPRVHQKSPPTDLIVATNGDLMRGRLLGLSDRFVWIESRLYRLEIDRNLVSHLVAFETEPGDVSDDAAAVPDDPISEDDLPVFAIAKNGDRLWLKPEQFEKGVLIGENRWLDQCRLPMNELAELHIGRELYDRSITTMEHDERYVGFPKPFIDWELKDAPKPPIPGAQPGESETAGPPGTASNLVGKEAPELKLPLLEGGEFDLSKERGKIVVLDFWASWCGPCMQAMPVVEKVIDGFDKSQVELVTVNLQEDKATIRETMKRLELDVRCAMDQEGLAAQRYQASAIPQTVIIDQKGVICRLFVGGGNEFGEQLDAALREVLNRVDL